MGLTKEKLWATNSSDNDEDSFDGAVAVIEMLRDHFGASDKKMSRSELLQQKEDAFLDMKTRGIKNLTEEYIFSQDGEEGKC